jgi:hypothetical protein
VAEGVLMRTLGDEAVLLDLKSERYFGLDDVGTAMWQALIAADSIESAWAALSAAYAVDGETLRADLATLSDTLLERQLFVLIA